MSYGESFRFTLFTNDPDIAAKADRAGVNRIGIDLERIGKTKRQNKAKSWISDHKIEDLLKIKKSITHAKLFARTEPINPSSGLEIEQLLCNGVQSLMLPMFNTASEASKFIDIISGRAEVILLLETAKAASNIHEIIRLYGIDEIHIGLNDLHISLSMRNHFEVLVSPIMEELAETILDAGIKLGFGGLARVNDDSLPVSPELVYAQYPRLAATGALISRVFLFPKPSEIDISHQIALSRKKLDYFNNCSKTELMKYLRLLSNKVSNLNSI